MLIKKIWIINKSKCRLSKHPSEHMTLIFVINAFGGLHSPFHSLMPSSWTDQEELAPHSLYSCGEPVWSDWVSYWKRWGTGDHSICCFWAPVHFHFHLMSRRDHRAVTRVKAFNISQSWSVCCSRGFVSLISARTIWADGWVRAARNGKPPNAEWDLASGPVAPRGRAIKVEASRANSWQEQELMAGQGREEQIHTDTSTHPHGVEGGTAKQGQKTLGNTNVATHDSGGVRDQIGKGQKDIWDSSIVIHQLLLSAKAPG